MAEEKTEYQVDIIINGELSGRYELTPEQIKEFFKKADSIKKGIDVFKKEL